MRLITSNANGTRPTESTLKVKQTVTPTLMTTPDGALIVSNAGPISGADPTETVGVLAVPEEVSFTRPADTDPYTENDEISTKTLAETGAQPITFQAMTRTGDMGSGYIVNARLKKSQNSITNASFRLYLFSGIPTMSGDNEPFVMTHLAAGYFGFIDFTFDVLGIQQAIGTFSGGGGPIGFYTPDGNLYGVLVARGAYTPASGEVFTPELTIDQN